MSGLFLPMAEKMDHLKALVMIEQIPFPIPQKMAKIMVSTFICRYC